MTICHETFPLQTAPPLLGALICEQHHLLRQGNQPRLILDSSLSYIQNVMVVQVEFSRKQALRWRLVGRKLMKACPSHLQKGNRAGLSRRRQTLTQSQQLPELTPLGALILTSDFSELAEIDLDGKAFMPVINTMICRVQCKMKMQDYIFKN